MLKRLGLKVTYHLRRATSDTTRTHLYGAHHPSPVHLRQKQLVRMDPLNKYVAMFIASLAGLIAGLLTLKAFGQPTPI